MSTLAGSPAEEGSADGIGASARFRLPLGIAVDASGTLYVADYMNHTIRKVTPNGAVGTLAGSPGQAGHADGIGAATRFNGPIGIAVGAGGTVYVTDYLNHTIRKIS